MIKLRSILEKNDYFAYRGDETEFDKFNVRFIGKSTQANVEGFWFTSNKENADFFGQHVRLFRLKINNPYIVDSETVISSWPKISSLTHWVKIAKEKGHDGVIFKNIIDGRFSARNTYCVFSPSQIKLVRKISESLLNEKSLDLSKKEDAAEHLIKLAWKFIPPGEDRYDANDIFLWIDNERPLSDLAWKLANQFYPDDDESWYTFQDDVKKVVMRMEQERLSRKKQANPSLADPLYILKKMMVKTKWDQIKRTLADNSVSGWIPHKRNETTSDEDAEKIFNRLYKNAMGETVYDKSMLDQYGFGRLSDFKIIPEESSNNPHQYAINVFLRHYGTNGTIGPKVKVWRGTNNPHASIRPGDYVTFDRGYAHGYSRGKWGAIVTDILDVKDLIVYKIEPGMSELVYWPEGHQIKKYEGPIPTLREFWEQYRFGI